MFEVQFICCRFLEARRKYTTAERAEEARTDWLEHGIIDGEPWWVGTDPSGHDRTAIVGSAS